ncbi:MAG: DNA-binding protein WhiA, partial [Clostridia bacterium]|nr:DNA-binding protein WhiA [Clostridia bacterium]
MSFSSGVKEELVRIRVKTPEQRLSELSGLTLCCGALRISRGLGVVYTSESIAVARRILSLAESLYALESTIELSEREQFKAPLVTVTLGGRDAETLLHDAGALSMRGGARAIARRIPDAARESDDCARAFLRGAFLGSGSCANPRRGYHLEIVVTDAALCGELAALAQRFSLP